MQEHVIRTRAESLALGLNRYFTGRPCKHGHTAPRFTTTGGCTQCVKLTNRQQSANRTARLMGYDTVTFRVPSAVRETLLAAAASLGCSPVTVVDHVVTTPALPMEPGPRPSGGWYVPPPPVDIVPDFEPITPIDQEPKLYIPNSSDYSLD